MHGYIYIRCHPAYDMYDVCKLGRTNNIPERDALYATCEPHRGVFTNVYRVPHEQLAIIERVLQHQFKTYHYYHDGGVEFYRKHIIHLIEPTFQQLGVKYTKLTNDEVSQLTRVNRLQSIYRKIDTYELVQLLHRLAKPNHTTYTPRPDQYEIIAKSHEFYNVNDKGILVLTCGVGKTLISLWISEKLNANAVVVGVPNVLLLQQWTSVVQTLFPQRPFLVVFGNTSTNDITRFLNENNSCVVITTYASSYKVLHASQLCALTFDMMILDEVHHLTKSNAVENVDERNYVKMLEIKCVKQLALTATLKIIENVDTNDDNVIISNDNREYFGDVIEKRSLLWAINNNIVCDYVVQTIVANYSDVLTDVFGINDEANQNLFLSAFVALKSINDNHSHHLLIYANSLESAQQIIKYIQLLLSHKYFALPSLVFSEYHSGMKMTHRQQILNDFNKSKCGILTCVYCLGEGWDLPMLDGVVFAENMTSNIRIIQSALRASRKNKKEPDKVTKIILPVLNVNDWINDTNNNNFRKIREVIYQIGLEDETINHKIQAFNVNICEQYGSHGGHIHELINVNTELTTQIKLHTLHRLTLGISYDKARMIIAQYEMRCKKDYYELCKIDARLPLEPETHFGSKFTNWVEYLSIPNVYYDYEKCKRKLSKYLKNTSLVNFSENAVAKLHSKNKKFPPYDIWCDYYGISNIGEMFEFNTNVIVEF